MPAGVPTRRVWLELRKLAKAEAQRPGAWPSALKLSYHLGLLPHVFPWLQPRGQPTSNRRIPGVDPYGQSRLTLPAVRSSSNDSSSDQSPSKAVAVAKQLSTLWVEQQKQHQGEAGVTGDMPLCLLVAATIHPSKEGYAQADTWVGTWLCPDRASPSCIIAAHRSSMLHPARHVCTWKELQLYS